MLKKFLLLVAMMPLLNFLHESGHWLGAKLVGADPKLFLQRVEIENESLLSPLQIAFYNWSGPAVNYVFIGASLFNPVLVPPALVMTSHRIGPNIFASYVYLNGNRNFTTDETKLFSKEDRIWIAISFSVLYLGVAVLLITRWLPPPKRAWAWAAIPAFSFLWFVYLIFLDYLDKRF